MHYLSYLRKKQALSHMLFPGARQKCLLIRFNPTNGDNP